MRRYGKKLTALLLALCMLLALAACGSGGDSGDAEQLSGTIYVPEFLECDLDLDYINSGCCDGRYVYVLGDVNTPQLYNAQGEVVRDMTEEEAEEFWNNPSAGEDGSYVGYASTSKIYRISIEDGAAEELENFSPVEIPEGQEGDTYISDLTTGADGTLWVTEQINTYTFDLPENFDPDHRQQVELPDRLRQHPDPPPAGLHRQRAGPCGHHRPERGGGRRGGQLPRSPHHR